MEVKNIRYLYQCLCLCVIFLVGCASNYAPVSDINRAPAKLSGIHIVQPGETLYAIGWRYNRDFKELAAVNHIHSPYMIHVGQEISLAPAPQVVAQTATPTPSAKVESPPKTSVVASSPVNEPQMPLVVNNSDWRWPVKGEIIAGFVQTKGIDIAGSSGTAIHAAQPGRVVYSGNGLRGYGQLLIIKHNEQYLSAYAHNSKLMVKEGDWVAVGQQIAQMGNTDTNRVKLHFEIRKDGKPVDPLKYLPT